MFRYIVDEIGDLSIFDGNGYLIYLDYLFEIRGKTMHIKYEYNQIGEEVDQYVIISEFKCSE